jgi:hypothetical protein
MAECQLQIPPVRGLEDNVITVGREFVLDCKGDFSKLGDSKEWTINFAENQNTHALKILNSEFVTGDELKLTVTSYTAGPQSFNPLQLKKGDEIIPLGRVDFNVQSVIVQKADQQVEPYGPMAVSLSWPLAFWIYTTILIIAIVTFSGLKILRRLQRKALLESLRRHDSASAPLAEFHQHYRRWRRENLFFHGASSVNVEQDHLKNLLTEVNQAFRVFLIREFKVPALQWSDRLILQEFKKYHKSIFELYGNDLRKQFTEVEKAKAAADQIKAQDVVQLTENLRKLAEKMDAAEKSSSKKGERA